MTIGINATAAVVRPRTGVESYVCHLIKGLVGLKESRQHRFILFLPGNGELDFGLPANFEARKLNWPLPFWTQARLAGEMLVKKPEILFIPVHILPIIHPQNSVVTIHGLEYEYFPETYPKSRLAYLKWSTAYAVKKARKIIAVSENTKKDLVGLYGVPSEKIAVVHHGVEFSGKKAAGKRSGLEKYFLYLGRLEEKKNVGGLVEGFEMLKKRYQLPHKLILAGPAGYGYEKIKSKISRLKYRDSVVELGYVSEQKKRRLLEGAEALVFPSLYEGFGLPILEAQASGCPVIASDVSSAPEVAGQGAILIEPEAEQIARAMYKIADEIDLKKRLVGEGYRNAKKFSWQKCARRTLRELTN